MANQCTPMLFDNIGLCLIELPLLLTNALFSCLQVKMYFNQISELDF